MPILDLNTYSTPKSNELLCPRCGSLLLLIPRTQFDRFVNFLSLGTQRKYRFKCRGCQGEIISNKEQ